MDDTWDVTEDSEEDVDEEVAATPALEEYTERWQDDGDDDFADVATPGNLSVVISQASEGSELWSWSPTKPKSMPLLCCRGGRLTKL